MTNRHHYYQSTTVWLISLALVLGLACQKKRDVAFTQGSADNLYVIEAFKNRTSRLVTLEKRFRGETSQATLLLTEEPFDDIREFPSVNYQLDDRFLESIDFSTMQFYGRPNHEYEIGYRVTDNHVIVSKIAHPNDLPSQELTYAQPAGDGKVAVAMFGIPLSLYRVEKVEDTTGKDTRKLRPFPQEFVSQSTHFQPNFSNIRFFSAPSKLDLFKADFFNETDEWFYSKTLVGRSVDSEERLGNQDSALRMRFTKTPNSILGVDINIAPEQLTLDPEKTRVALEIPVEWVDFRLEKAGSDAFLKETKISDGDPDAKFWSERKYLLVDFNNADRLQKSKTQENKLEKLEISDDYISFNIFESDSGNTYKYSMVKAPEKVDGQSIQLDDKSKFHFFTSLKNVIRGNLFSQVSDIEDLYYIKRIYPRDGEIKFYVTDNTPDLPHYNRAINKAIASWDKAFEEAGLDVDVTLADERVEMGDVRYHKITFHGYEIDAGNLLGLGPSVSDTRTGEIYSATTNIYLRTYREGLIGNIRSFIRDQLGLYEGKGIVGMHTVEEAVGNVLQGEGFSPAAIDSISGNGISQVLAQNFAIEPSSDFYLSPDYSSYQISSLSGDTVYPVLEKSESHTASPQDISDLAKLHLLEETKLCDFGNIASVAVNFSKIRASCMEGKTQLGAYIQELIAEHKTNPAIQNLQGEHEAVLECAEVLMEDLLVSTLIHEMGHNFGLGHNFKASMDEKNFAMNGTEVAYKASSVMDYPDRDFTLFTKPGPYDVAAIRFSHSRKVETSEPGKMITIPRDVSIDAYAQLQGVSLRKFEMCPDSAVDTSNNAEWDPLCRRWDVGTDPVQSTEWAISKIASAYILSGYQYNDLFERRHPSSYFPHLKRIYEYWRTQFNLLDVEDPYITSYTDSDIAALVEANADSDGFEELMPYRKATQKIFDFLEEIVLYPTMFCKVGLEGPHSELLEFKRSRQDIYAAYGDVVQTCDDLIPYMDRLVEGASSQSVMAMNRIGTALYDQSAFLNPVDFAEEDIEAFGIKRIYSLGILNLKEQALSTMLSREPYLKLSTAGEVERLVSFMDNEYYRSRFIEKVIDRIVNGIPGEHFGMPRGTYVRRAFAETQDFWIYVLKTLVEEVESPQTAGIAGPLKSIEDRYMKNYTAATTPGRIYDHNRINRLIYADDNRQYAKALLKKYSLMTQAQQLDRIKQESSEFVNNVEIEFDKDFDIKSQSFTLEATQDLVRPAVYDFLAANSIYLQHYQWEYLDEVIAAKFPEQAMITEEEYQEFARSVAADFIQSNFNGLMDEELAFLEDDPVNFRGQVLILSAMVSNDIFYD